jgi:tetratricopeptide (TPR) repeat protein
MSARESESVNDGGRVAAGLKAEGNAAFKAFRLIEALEKYSAAIVAAPAEPVYRANRSAALYEVGRYAECIADVEGALELQLELTLAEKLMLRASRSALWLGDEDGAQHWLNQAISKGASGRQATDVAKFITACENLDARARLASEAQCRVVCV